MNAEISGTEKRDHSNARIGKIQYLIFLIKSFIWKLLAKTGAKRIESGPIQRNTYFEIEAFPTP